MEIFIKRREAGEMPFLHIIKTKDIPKYEKKGASEE